MTCSTSSEVLIPYIGHFSNCTVCPPVCLTRDDSLCPLASLAHHQAPPADLRWEQESALPVKCHRQSPHIWRC